MLVPLVQWSGMASTGNVHFYPCLYSYCACTIAQRVLCVYPLYNGLASTGRVPIGPCLYSYCGCTVPQCVLCLYLLYSGLAWPARVMYILPVFVLVLCVYYCTVCTMRVPLVQWFSTASTCRVLIGPYLYSYCGGTIAQCVLCLYLLYSVLAWPTRVMYRSFPCLYKRPSAAGVREGRKCTCPFCSTICLHGLYNLVICCAHTKRLTCFGIPKSVRSPNAWL